MSAVLAYAPPPPVPALTQSFEASLSAASPIDPAAARIGAFYGTLVTVGRPSSKMTVAQRERALSSSVRRVFDVSAMCRTPQATPSAAEPRAESFDVPACEDKATTTIARAFARHPGKIFVVDPVAAPRGSDRIVTTLVRLVEGRSVVIRYVMRQVAAGWRVVDVDGGGLAATAVGTLSPSISLAIRADPSAEKQIRASAG